MAIIDLPANFVGTFKLEDEGYSVLGKLTFTNLKASATDPFSDGDLIVKIYSGVGYGSSSNYTLTYSASGWSGEVSLNAGSYKVTIYEANKTDEYLLGYVIVASYSEACKNGALYNYDRFFEIDVSANQVKVYWFSDFGDDDIPDPRFSIDNKQTWDPGTSGEYPFPMSKTYSYSAVYDTTPVYYRVGADERNFTLGVTDNGAFNSHNGSSPSVIAQRVELYRNSAQINIDIKVAKVGSPDYTLAFYVHPDNGSNEPDTSTVLGSGTIHTSEFTDRIVMDIPLYNPPAAAGTYYIKYFAAVFPSTVTHDGSNYVQFKTNGNGEYSDGGIVIIAGSIIQYSNTNWIGNCTNVYNNPIPLCSQGPLILGEIVEEDCIPVISDEKLYTNCTRFVLDDGTNTYEIKEPVGWDGVDIMLKRDEVYLGVLFSYTDGSTTLKFGEIAISGYDCSKKILDDAYELSGSDAYIAFKFQVQVEGVWYNAFSGLCDFSEYRRGLHFSQVQVRRISFNDEFNNYIDTEVDVLSSEDIKGNVVSELVTQPVFLHSRHIRKVYRAHQNSAIDNPNLGQWTVGAFEFFYYEPNDIQLDNIPLKYNYPTGQLATVPGEFIDFENNGPLLMELQWDIYLDTATEADTLDLVVFLRAWEVFYGSPYVDVPLNVTKTYLGTVNSKELWRYTIDQDTVNKNLLSQAHQNALLFIYFQGNQSSSVTVTVDETLTDNYTLIKQDTVGYNTKHQLPLAMDLLKGISNRISGAPIVSTFLNSQEQPGQLVFSDGLGLRGIESSWFVSFRTVLDSLKSLFDLGLGIQKICPGSYEQIVIEHRSYFFRAVEVSAYTEVEDFTQYAATEYLFNEMKIGYDQYQKEREGALGGYCTEQNRITPIVYYKQLGEITCPAIADHYMLEEYRRQRDDEDEEETANEEDRNLFVIDTDEYSSKKLYQEDGQRVRYDSTINSAVMVLGEVCIYLQPGDSVTISDLDGVETDKTFTITNLIFDKEKNATDIEGYSGSAFSMNNFEIQFPSDKRLAVRHEEFSISDDIIRPVSIYNARLTPVEMIINNRFNLATLFGYKNKSTTGLRFTSGQQNFKSSINPSTRSPEVSLDEFLSGDDIDTFKGSPITLAPLPTWVEFTTETTIYDIMYLEQAFRNMGTPEDYGYITVTNPEDGNQIRGWPYECKYNPGTKRSRFKLLKIEDVLIVEKDSLIGCLTESSVNLSSAQPAIAQRISLPLCTSIDITVYAAGSGAVNFYLAPIDDDGLPDTANKVVNKNINLISGENKISTEVAITDPGVYCYVLEYISTSVALKTMSQSTPPGCQDKYLMCRQIYTTGWQLPSDLTPLKHGLKYSISGSDVFYRAIVSNSNNYAVYINGTVNKAGQQIQVFDDITLSQISIWSTHSGSPTGTCKMSIYTQDGSGHPDSLVASSDPFTPLSGNQENVIDIVANLSPGDYVFLIEYQNDGTIDATNMYIFRRVLHSSAYQYGYIVYFDTVWNNDTSRNLFIKYKFN